MKKLCIALFAAALAVILVSCVAVLAGAASNCGPVTAAQLADLARAMHP